jgi:CYTH domain-containing protein
MIENLSLFPPVEKVRYSLTFDGWSWVVDVFSGANRGLVLAEIELPSPTTAFPEPPWLGVEVSDDPRYFNSRLTQCPFTTWPENNP